METVRITAKTVDEAVEEGLKKLGLSRAEAVIRVIEQPSSGLFGLFNKKDAVVEVGAAGSETEDAAETAGDMTSAVAGAADGEEETVSAAEEAAMLGYRAVAVSRDTLGTDYFDDAAVHFCSNIDLFIGCLTESHRLLNVNYPYLPANEYRGIRVGYLAEQIYPIAYIEIKDENGSIGYKTPSNKLTSCAEHDTTDEKFVRDGFIAVTPLKYDITDYERLEQIAAFAERTY